MKAAVHLLIIRYQFQLTIDNKIEKLSSRPVYPNPIGSEVTTQVKVQGLTLGVSAALALGLNAPVFSFGLRTGSTLNLGMTISLTGRGG